MQKYELTQQRQKLLNIMQEINFGGIEQLEIRNGQPVMERYHRIIKDIKFGGDNGMRVERSMGEYALKKQHHDLFDQLDCLRNAVICQLVIQNGLPIKMSVEEIVA